MAQPLTSACHPLTATIHTCLQKGKYEKGNLGHATIQSLLCYMGRQAGLIPISRLAMLSTLEAVFLFFFFIIFILVTLLHPFFFSPSRQTAE